MEIWEPKTPGTLWATPGPLRDSFTLQIEAATSSEVSVSVYNKQGVVSRIIEIVNVIAFRTLNITRHRCIKFK